MRSRRGEETSIDYRKAMLRCTRARSRDRFRRSPRCGTLGPPDVHSAEVIDLRADRADRRWRRAVWRASDARAHAMSPTSLSFGLLADAPCPAPRALALAAERGRPRASRSPARDAPDDGPTLATVYSGQDRSRRCASSARSTTAFARPCGTAGRLRHRSGRARLCAGVASRRRCRSVPLDGELWLGRGRFDALSAIVRRTDAARRRVVGRCATWSSRCRVARMAASPSASTGSAHRRCASRARAQLECAPQRRIADRRRARPRARGRRRRWRRGSDAASSRRHRMSADATTC